MYKTHHSFLRFHTLLLLALCLLVTAASQAADPFAPATSTTSRLLGAQDEFLPVAEAFKPRFEISDGTLALTWEIADTYYLYEERFSFKTQPEVSLTPSYSAGHMKYDELFERETMVHYQGVTAELDITQIQQPFSLKVEYQGCADAGLCYPPQTLRLEVDPLTGTVMEELPLSESNEPLPMEAPMPGSNWLWQAMALALLGGIILNLMPCVFPVLSIKVMSLAAADRRRLALHGWVYALGIVLCFIGFAVALLVARKGGEAVGWGFQLQSPGLIGALTYLFFLLGLSMSGLIQVGSRWMGAGQTLAHQSGLGGSFFTGVLAAVVASPCTAPFMGAALGFALTQPPLVCIAVFTALGLGMALPLVVLCYLPSLAARLPKPGVWMDNLKQILAFPLYLSAIWLLWVYGRQTGVNGMASLCLGALLLTFGCWLLNRRTQGLWQAVRRVLILLSGGGALLLLLKVPAVDTSTNSQAERWQPYNPQRLAELRTQGRPVFINLTADWCLTCLVNERIALETAAVEAVFDSLNVATLKGDWTHSDPQITALLQEYGRSGVPLYLWFPTGHTGKAQVLPQLLTQEIIIERVKP